MYTHFSTDFPIALFILVFLAPQDGQIILQLFLISHSICTQFRFDFTSISYHCFLVEIEFVKLWQRNICFDMKNISRSDVMAVG